jgi:hypothetical protein
MIRAAVMAGLLLALAAAAPAIAQPPPRDPIDDLLRPDVPQPPAPAAPSFEPAPAAVPPPPLPLMPPPRGSEAGPVPVEQAGKTPDGPATEADLAYDNRLRASMASSQGLRGAMDGGWSLMARSMCWSWPTGRASWKAPGAILAGLASPASSTRSTAAASRWCSTSPPRW